MEANKPGLWARLRQGLTKTKQTLIEKIRSTVGGRALSEEVWEELEEVLIQADVGVQTSFRLLEAVRKQANREKVQDTARLMQIFKEQMSAILERESSDQPATEGKPHVVLVVGVNGVGKTTSIGKLAHHWRSQGKSVLMAAADTFRAAAADQLQIWAERTGSDIVRHQEGADPAAVAFDAIRAARARDRDIVLIDTAGRLHNKVNLMNELEKIKRVVQREMPAAPHEVLLVLDATTGQNGLEQARTFQKAVDISGIVLTKLDGTAKGGIVFAISEELGIPVRWVGVGERADDLQPFQPEHFLDALFSDAVLFDNQESEP